MSIADACLCELCSLGERILRKQERNSREIPVLPNVSMRAPRAYARI